MVVKYFSFLLLLASIKVSFAQNLVPNPSFENHTQCPDNNSEVNYATGWWGVNESPDYFNACATWVSFSVPHNFVGGQVPFDGNAYIGICPFDFSSNYREIVGTELIDSIISGHTYLLSMRVSRANAPTWTLGSNKMGMRFSNDYYSFNSPHPIDNFAHVSEDSVITDSTNWILLSWTFTPTTAFKYLYIGNFFNDANTDTLQLGATPFRSYYYIDQVEVICQNTNCNLSIQSQASNAILKVYPNPIHQAVNITIPSGSDLIQIFNALGQPVYAKTVMSLQETVDLSLFPSGLYSICVYANGEMYSRKAVKQ